MQFEMCRSMSAKGELIEQPKRKHLSQMEVMEDFESRPHRAVSFCLKVKRRYRHGTRRSCRRCCLVTVEED